MNTYSAQAENSLAGCLLVDPERTLRDVRGIVCAADFQGEAARAIYNAVSTLVAKGEPCDPVLIQAEAERQGRPISADYCAELMSLFTTTANVEATAQIIRDEAQKRRGREIGAALTAGELSATDALARLQELIQAQGDRLHSPAEAADAVMDFICSAASGDTRPFLKTGFPSLDAQLAGGLAAGGLITIAARPGVGKTTAALAIADSIATNIKSQGGKILYISLEMTEAQLWACRVASASGLSRSDVYAGRIGEEGCNWKRLTGAFEKLSTLPLFIRDIPATMEDIERTARGMDDLQLLIVDHIGLVKPTEPGSRYEQMTQTSHKLKQLALSLKIPIIALCQLNRQSEARQDKRPGLADLRDSGAIEEDSDIVALLFRPGMFGPKDQRPKPWEQQPLLFIVDKNRHGPTGETTMAFIAQTGRVCEWA